MANIDNKINIGDTWKDLDSIQINIGDVWKDVSEGYVNVGDVWKQFWTATTSGGGPTDWDLTFGTQYSISTQSNDMSVDAIDDTHIILCYQDFNDSSYGKAVIGTISNGDEISWGTVYTFNSDYTGYINVKKIDTNKAIITFMDNNTQQNGRMIVATISNGDEISFGTNTEFWNNYGNKHSMLILDTTHFVVFFHINDNNYIAFVEVDGTGFIYDKFDDIHVYLTDQYTEIPQGCLVDTNKFVLIYNYDVGYDSKIFYKVCTFDTSTKSITQGTQGTVNDDGDTTASYIISQIDTNKVFITIDQNYGTDDGGRGVVGEVSGMSMTLGTFNNFLNEADGLVNYGINISIGTDHVLISYADYVTNTNRPGYSVVGSIDGTTITYDTARVKYNTGDGTSYYNNSCKIDDTHVCVVWRNYINSTYTLAAKIGTIT